MTKPDQALLKLTTSRCIVCGESAPATVVAEAGKIYLDRECATHGAQRRLLSSDERFYHVSHGSVEKCCGGQSCCGDTPTDPFATLSTCLALIEIVDSCNLACPTCFADSPQSRDVKCVSLADFQQRVEGVIRSKGKIEVLQLSGGETTIHPEFFPLLEWCQQHPNIEYIMVNTNRGAACQRRNHSHASLNRK